MGVQMIQYLTMGALLGISAGLAPGPLLALVVSETLSHNIRAGIKVAVAPLITDLPIIAVAVLILSRLSGSQGILGAISLMGGVLVLVMGIHGMKAEGLSLDIPKTAPKSLTKGILVNALSPHPYLFWLSVGGPIMAKAGDRHVLAPAAFLLGFYLLMVGSKMALAVLAGKSKAVLTGRSYVLTMRCLGFLLCVLAIFLFKDGIRLLWPAP
jgi:threonine/homoserine/homoserine lactone efflux protein